MNLPNNWCSIRLDLIVNDLQPGFAQRPGEDKAGIPQLRTNNVSPEGSIDLTELKYVTVDHKDIKKYSIEVGDVIFNNTNSVEWVGKTAYFAESGIYVLSNHMTRIRANLEVLDPEYLAIYLHFLWRTGRSRRYAKQWVNQAAIDRAALGSFEIILPPLSEQQRIAALLRESDELRRLRRQADERSRDLLPALFQEMFGDINKLEKRWKMVTVEEAGQVQLGRQRTPKYQTGQFSRPYLRVANVFENRIDISDVLSMDFDQVDFKKYQLEYGDILLNEGQSIELVGRPAMWRGEIPDCCFQNTLIRFKANKKLTLPEYALAVFLIYFRSGRFSAIGSQTSNVAHLGAARFAKMPFPLPPLEVQRQFVAQMEELRQNEDLSLSGQQYIESLFASFLARAFTGELTASWREAHDEQLREEAVQRDIALGLRGAEPTIGDLEVGRVTRAEQEEANRLLAQTIEQLRSIPSNAFQGLIAETFGDIAKLDINTLLGSNAQAIRAMQVDVQELLAAQMAPVSALLADQLSGLTQQIQSLHLESLSKAAFQPSPELSRQIAGWLANIGRLGAVAEVLSSRKALRDTLSEDLSTLLSKVAAAPPYFRPADLQGDEISLLQVEERLRLLVALGIVRPVMVQGQACYRLVSQNRDYAVPEGLES